MKAVTLHAAAPGVTRNRLDRFASLHAQTMAERAKEREERLLDEERAAIRIGTQSSCQKDRSAVEALAEFYRVNPSTIYGWAEGRTRHNPLRDFCAFVDQCLAAKGADNPAALEPVRLLRRRYLDGETRADLAGVVGTCASAMKEAGEAVAAAIAAARDGWVARDEVSSIEAEIDEAIGALHRLRREVQACTETR